MSKQSVLSDLASRVPAVENTADFIAFVDANYTAIYEEVRAITVSLYNEKGHLDISDPYIPDFVDAYFSSSTSIKYSAFLPHMLAYCVAAYDGISCHELIFGERKPVELRGHAKAVLQYAFSVPGETRRQLQAILDENPSDYTNPAYLVWSRTTEAAISQGLSLRNYTSPIFIKSIMQHSIYQNFYEDAVIEPHISSAAHAFGYSIGLFTFVLLAVGIKDLSADYLLTHDYSPFAQLDGKNLSTEQQAFLRSYLLASEKAQKEAILSIWLRRLR